MAGTQIESKPRIITPRNTRLNEIVAILLLAIGLLLALCLVSAAFYPNDPSWNSAGQAETHNLTGPIGANVAAALFQFVGLAAYLLPILFLAAAWRRFRTRSIRAPLTRIIGLVMLVLSAAALLAISNLHPLFDQSVPPGGLAGALISRTLASGLNTVGAIVLLVALAATGLLLTTNFSFVGFYEQIVAALSNRLEFFRRLPGRFRNWRAERREQTRLRKEARQAAKAEFQAAQQSLKSSPALSPSERVAEFMSANESAAKQNATVIRGETEVFAANTRAAAATAGVQRTGAFELGTAQPLNGRGSRSSFVDDDEVEEMVKGVSVLRKKAEAPAAGKLPFDADRNRRVSYSDYSLPPLEYLNEAPPHSEQADAELLAIATRLAEKCKEFNVTGQIKHICPGPVVTTYEFKPDPGVKYSRITSLSDDLCLALKAESIRIDRMPGKPHVGIEVPNPRRETIFLREIIESRPFRESGSKLTIALGKTIDGLNYVSDLAKMPHLLIAGTTGAGKSVGVNALIVSILYRARPDEVKFILIDPKRLERGLDEDIPHLITPIIVDPKLASRSLKWAVAEMERRYRDLAGWGVRNIDGYNTEIMRRNLVQEYDDKGEPWKPLPYLVIIIDELADLMMTSGREVEESITRLAQMARAVGIHLVLATQRPSVDVITGLIKANFPSRISFRVSSKIHPRTIS